MPILTSWMRHGGEGADQQVGLRATARWTDGKYPRVELTHRTRSIAHSIPDLIIASTAEKVDLTVLAVDKDFDLITGITGQPVEILALI